MQCLGSSVESPQSLMLLQYLLTGTQRPFWHVNSDTLHFCVTCGIRAASTIEIQNSAVVQHATAPETITYNYHCCIVLNRNLSTPLLLILLRYWHVFKWVNVCAIQWGGTSLDWYWLCLYGNNRSNSTQNVW